MMRILSKYIYKKQKYSYGPVLTHYKPKYSRVSTQLIKRLEQFETNQTYMIENEEEVNNQEIDEVNKIKNHINKSHRLFKKASHSKVVELMRSSNLKSVNAHLMLAHYIVLYNFKDYFPFITLSVADMKYFSLSKFFKVGDILRDLCLLPYCRQTTKNQLYLRCAYSHYPDKYRAKIEVVCKKTVNKLTNTSILRFCRLLTGHQTTFNNELRKRRGRNPEYPHYYWNHIKKRIMKMIDEYKAVRIGEVKANEKKKKLEQELVEFFYLFVINNKGLQSIKEDVKYICRKYMKRILMSMDDADSDMEEENSDVKIIQKSIDTQELNLIRLTRIAAVLSYRDIVEEHAYHWSVLEEEVEQLIEYAECADTLASLMTSFLKVHSFNIKSIELINKLYNKFQTDYFHELEKINVNISLRLATEILKNESVLGRENTENIIEFIGYILFQDSFNNEANDREFEDFCIAIIQYMPGTGGKAQFRVAANTKSFTVLSLMVKTIEQRITIRMMNKKSLARIIYNSCRYSFDSNVNYILEKETIRNFFLRNIDTMDLHDMHILWIAIWDWPECFRNESQLQQYLIDKVFKEQLIKNGESRIPKMFQLE